MKPYRVWLAAAVIALFVTGAAVGSQRGASDKPGAKHRVVRARVLQKLSPKQRAQLRAKVRKMRAAGASREEIRTTVREMLKGWGVAPPKQPLLNALRKLTPEQRVRLRARIRETVRKFLRETEASS